jgi:hypothetical protein
MVKKGSSAKGGLEMVGDSHDNYKLRAQRREFLLQCGRFAVVTPPVVTLMLSVDDKGMSKALAASPGRKATTTTRPTTTTKTTTKPTTTTKTTTRTTSQTTTTVTKSVTTSTATTTTGTTSATFTTINELIGPGPKQDSHLAMMIDSLGLMKII